LLLFLCLYFVWLYYIFSINYQFVRGIKIMKLPKLVFLFCLLGSFSAAKAQDLSYIQDEMNAIREDLKILQRQVYRRSNQESSQIPAQVLQASDKPISDVKKMGEYDQMIRDMNGKIDEIEYKVKQLESKIETMNNDFDVRFKLIEGKPITSGMGTSSAAVQKYDTKAVNAPKFVAGEAVYGEALKPLRTQNASAETIYKTGLESLKVKNYVAASENFKTVIANYPNDKLAGNAQYWLGEVFYAQKDYKNAAIAFAGGYEKYKDNPKAADSFFKLGMSMLGLGKKDEACSAFLNLAKEFPKSSSELKLKANDEAKKQGCK